jgi:hypothetical protein
MLRRSPSLFRWEVEGGVLYQTRVATDATEESMKKIVGWFEQSDAVDHALAELARVDLAPEEVEARVESGEGAVVVIRCDDARAAAAMHCLAAAGARRVALETLPAGERAEPA